MNFSDVMSDFQLKATRVKDLSVKNDFINLFDSEELETSVSIHNDNSNIMEKEDSISSVFTLDLLVITKGRKSSKEITINISIEGLFISKNKDKSLFNQMLFLNGNSTLYSIARAQIITISSMVCNTGDIVLPMINFVEMLKAKQNENEID